MRPGRKEEEPGRAIVSRQPVDSRTEDVTRSALQAENGTPARRRPEFHAWRLLSTACRDRKQSAPSHQASPAVSIEILVAAIGAEQRTQPRARVPALLDALERMCAVRTDQLIPVQLQVRLQACRGNVEIT